MTQFKESHSLAETASFAELFLQIYGLNFGHVNIYFEVTFDHFCGKQYFFRLAVSFGKKCGLFLKLRRQNNVAQFQNSFKCPKIENFHQIVKNKY